MSEKKDNRAYWIHIRMTKTELEKLNKEFSNSIYRKRSEFARKKLLNKPVTVFYRSKSFDEFSTIIILLRNELSAIGNNFNQAVKRLHTLDHIPEIKQWATTHESHQQKFLHKVAEIKEQLNKIADQWSQESTAGKA
jgi:hypothetical protein